eukprot:scaffold1903_cov396-Prasinococcus_capsulatus_cf.AAC.16
MDVNGMVPLNGSTCDECHVSLVWNTHAKSTSKICVCPTSCELETLPEVQSVELGKAVHTLPERTSHARGGLGNEPGKQGMKQGSCSTRAYASVSAFQSHSSSYTASTQTTRPPRS